MITKGFALWWGVACLLVLFVLAFTGCTPPTSLPSTNVVGGVSGAYIQEFTLSNGTYCVMYGRGISCDFSEREVKETKDVRM